jgi:DNA-binding XRE family transcriptional regulator
MDNFDLKKKQKQMIAGKVKELRLGKGYTQQELSDLSNISVRSTSELKMERSCPGAIL